MTTLIHRVTQTIARHDLLAPGARVIVAVSGGADSLALLHILRELSEQNGYRLHVATLDHGIRGAAGAEDAEFVQAAAQAWNLPVTVGRVDVPALARDHGWGIEDAARRARYTFLLNVAQTVGADRIALGHHRDDQAETVLMRLIRGSGLDGLAGMRPRAPLSDHHLLPDSASHTAPESWPDSWPILVRPLLDVSRAEIEAYCAAQNLRPRHDATNADTAPLRNRLRHDVIPLLEKLNPNVIAALARTADLLREDAALVHRAGETALDRITREIRQDSLILDRAGWDTLAVAEQRAVIRAAVRRLRPDLRDLSYEHVESARAILAADHPGPAAATLPGGLLIREGRGILADILTIGPADRVVLALIPGQDAPALRPGLASPPNPDATAGCASIQNGEGEYGARVPDSPSLAWVERADQWSGPGGEVFYFTPNDTISWTVEAWTFRARPLIPDAEGDDVAAIHADPLTAALSIPTGAILVLRTRRPGDRFQPRGMGGRSQKLADTFNTMGVPAAWRDRVPLLVVDGVIAWFVAPGTPGTAKTGGLRGRVAEPFALPAMPDSPGSEAPDQVRIHIVVGWYWGTTTG